MDRFRTSLCLNGVRTSDYVPLHVVDAQTLSLKGKLVSVDEVVELALPSKVAAAMMSSMAAVPAYSYAMFFLLGSQVYRGRLGDAVVHNIIRDQACYRPMLDKHPVTSEPLATARTGRNGAGAAPLQYEECLLFGYDGGALACETLRASDSAEAVDEVLRTLQAISLAVFKYTENKTCAVLVSSHLSTAHMAALFLASHRHVFLYVDEIMSAEEVLATTAEMQQVRDSLSSFAAPLAVDVERAQRTVARSDDGASILQSSCTLRALAHTGKEYEVLLAAVGQEWAEQQKRHPSCRSHDVVTTSENGEVGSGSLLRALRRELEEVRAAQRVAEDALADERRVHRKEVLSLRAALESAQRRGVDDTAASEVLNRSTVNGRVVSQNLLHSLQQQQHSHHHHSNDAASSAVILQLRKALQDALKAQQFAEEKVHLLELRQSLTTSGSQSAPNAAGDASGAVNSPRPSLRLQPVATAGVAAATPSTRKPPTWEQKLLQQENAALVAEFQRKEKAWQQQLRQASAEAGQLKQERVEMEATLRLQSQAIAAAQQALVDSRVAQEQEMRQLLERVRVLSQESRSRHRSQARSADTDQACGSQGSVEMAEAGVLSSSVSRTPQRQSTQQPPLVGSSTLKAKATSGGMMSPHR
ncbi:hypothetical protein GH5_02855 [Leishmania sp. Ghana 2012 LV757]|uniref:hypothetical protein n=1 Tax=Leishmania sp. Ghana 2012 LV757 TaxID=2803181 RepID=UPI001B68EE1B|nr:hypothetical protein GH5_02855 [Leishmania sp. Ghana 2012 LV757]